MKVHVYAAPGHRRYEVIRDVVSRGASGVLFVVDSSRGVGKYDLRVLREMRRRDIPVVVCANKQDLEGCLTPEDVEKLVDGLPVVPTIAKDGVGCREALEKLLSLVGERLNGVAPP